MTTLPAESLPDGEPYDHVILGQSTGASFCVSPALMVVDAGA
jgi:hypothetical protein